jgi:hypothetical protein
MGIQLTGERAIARFNVLIDREIKSTDDTSKVPIHRDFKCRVL